MYKIRNWLFIGKYAHTKSKDLLQSYQIDAMLQLAEEVKQENIESIYLDVEDGVFLPHDKLAKGVEFIQAQKRLGKTILVACGAGISRSVAFGMAALVEEEGLSIWNAYGEIYKHYQDAMPNPELCRSLAQYYHQEDIKLIEAWDRIMKIQKSIN